MGSESGEQQTSFFFIGSETGSHNIKPLLLHPRPKNPSLFVPLLLHPRPNSSASHRAGRRTTTTRSIALPVVAPPSFDEAITMDAKKKNKALYRSKLEAHKQKTDKRIDSPLVRYNESDQPICRFCDVILKSDIHWEAHQVSSKHHEAIKNFKANAARLAQAKNVKPESRTELCKPEMERSMKLQNVSGELSAHSPKLQASSVLPADFFDGNLEKKRQRTDSPKLQASSVLPADFFDSNLEKKRQRTDSVKLVDPVMGERSELQSEKELTQSSANIVGSDNKQARGALPEGFFDNKDADLRARGVEPVKPNVKDEYKEFEKLIQEDLREVDNRLEEEEFDAAEMIEEAESMEQKTFREKVDILKKKKLELKAARSAKRGKVPEVNGKKSSNEQSSSDDDSDENFAVDWRAQHL